ncbi:TetR/AcrR family transcriptional regulator [Nocardia neocaledoniensis]|uniref:TetR/AcrR family transcriptional regulator n=1 Tax=Nocardia neocaledoniensis TaxID=236511 RepID=UPI0033F71C7B
MATAKQAGGRPRESRVDASIAAAVGAVIAERGYSGLTVDLVAQHAGIGKAAIYRRYSTKQEMIFAILLHTLQEAPPDDSGTLAGDLAALTEQIAAQVVQAGGDTLSGLLADVRADPVLRAQFAQTFLTVERGIIATVLERAVTRGELPAKPDTVVVQTLLLGPLYTWMAVLDEDPASMGMLTQIVASMTTSALNAGIVPAAP